MTEIAVSADLLALVRRAINDPGKTVQREDGESVGSWSARAVLADLAQLLDPGDLPARMAWEIRNTECEHFGRDGGACSRCRATAALTVRWETTVQQAAENAKLRRKLEHAEDAAQLHDERADRWRRARDEAVRHRTQAENRASLYREQAADFKGAVDRARNLHPRSSSGVVRDYVLHADLHAALDGDR